MLWVCLNKALCKCVQLLISINHLATTSINWRYYHSKHIWRAKPNKQCYCLYYFMTPTPYSIPQRAVPPVSAHFKSLPSSRMYCVYALLSMTGPTHCLFMRLSQVTSASAAPEAEKDINLLPSFISESWTNLVFPAKPSATGTAYHSRLLLWQIFRVFTPQF